MITLFAIGAVVAMTQLNRFAAASRVRTLAIGAAQQRVDEVLTTPWSLSSRPAVLASGTRTESNLPLNNDAFNSRPDLRSAFTDLDVQVNGTRITQITDLPPRRVRAVVTVSYIYRGRTYDVSLITIRSTDNI